MDLENDPEFWKWLIEQQKDQNNQQEPFQPLVLDLPLPPPKKKENHPEIEEDQPDNSPNDEVDIFGGDYVIYEL